MTTAKNKKKLNNRSALSAAEKEILKWVQEGKTNNEIGGIIGKSKETVKFHLKNIMKRMDVVSRTQAVSKAMSQGLLPEVLSHNVMKAVKTKVCIVGCGKGGTAILDIFKEDPSIEVVGVSDENPDAKGIGLAKSLNIPTTTDYREIIKIGTDIIINVTGSKKVRDEIKKLKPPDTELMEGLSARLLWQLVEERRKRIKERERVLKEHESLYHLGLVIENIDSMKDAGLAIVDYATKLTSTPAGSLALFDERNEDMILVASKGFSSDFKKVDRWYIRQGGLTSYILNQKSPFVISDLKAYPDPNPVLIREGVRSLLAAPLTIEGRIVGILYVNDFKKRSFRADDVSLFSLLTVYAALTIERVKSIEEMRTLSITDGLTNLYNHRYLMEQMQKEIQRAERHNHPLSVIMLDIDHFKEYNDKFGHLEGNKVLKSIARILTKTARTTDIVGRFGGEEFCIIVPEIEKHGAVLFAKRLLNEVINVSPSFKKTVTISGGVAVFPKDGKIPVELINKADMLLYKAKRQGRNKVCS
ncbi:MAG: diguanylate cyclase [Deltaproteobacteria bacterium]|nr:diguanylate cyclase [Deltaproteobacteria bacterium]